MSFVGSELLALDATGQAEAVGRGDVSPVELVDAAIAAAEALNPSLNAIIHERYQRARDEAVARREGPFAGVPMVVKDLGAQQAGEPHHRGTTALKDIGYVGPHDSALWRRFRDAGFIAIGRTNTPELGSTITTEPVAYGPTRNPWHLDHSTGGSSGGSAAAVAASIVAVGHANDGGGSIRIPASECGLVGLKPSRGRVSQAPDLGESWAGATIDGAVTRSVRDAAAVLDVIAGYEPGDPYTAVPFSGLLFDEVGVDPGRLRIGLLDRSPTVPAHPDCVTAVEHAGRLLAELGHDVEVSAPDAMFDPGMLERFLTILFASSAVEGAELEALLGRPLADGDLEPANLAAIHLGRSIGAVDYLAAVNGQHRWTREMLSWWHPLDGQPGFDILVSPVIAGPPPLIGYLSGPEADERLRDLLQYTAQFNVTGQPAISLPLWCNDAGLPIGVQFVAAHHREDVLVRLAAQLEAAEPWIERRPLVSAAG